MQRAVIIVPVCDSGEIPSLKSIETGKEYNELPFSGGLKQFVSCPRVHQFIFNEQVDIESIKRRKNTSPSSQCMV